MTLMVKRALILLVALLLGIAPALGLLPVVPPQAADAFNPPIHIAMFEQALGSTFSPEARGWVAEGLTRSDVDAAGQGRPEWHFDSANSPTAICNRWSAGPDALLRDAERQAVEAFRIDPTDSAGFDRLGTHRAEALRFYGQYLHAIQDFYTHTNWIELHLDPTTQVTLTTVPPLAPIQQGCDIQALPKELQSGLFGFDAADLLGTIADGAPDFCGPVTAPRPPQGSGFRYCHGPPHPETIEELLASTPAFMVTLVNLRAGRDVSQRTLDPQFMLSKDLPELDHGAELLLRSDGTLASYHEEAVRLATEATRETFAVFKQRVETAFSASPNLTTRDPACLFQVLVQGGDPACPRQPTSTPTGGLYRLDAETASVEGLLPTLLAECIPGSPWLSQCHADEWKLRAFHADVRLDPTRISGALTFDLFNQDALERGKGEQYRVTFAGEDQANVTDRPLDDLEGVGLVNFVGRQSTYDAPPDDPQKPFALPDRGIAIAVVLDDAGQLVVCARFTSINMSTATRQECLANPIAMLEPVAETLA